MRNRAACEMLQDSAPASDPSSIARRLGAETLATYDEFAALIRASSRSVARLVARGMPVNGQRASR